MMLENHPHFTSYLRNIFTEVCNNIFFIIDFRNRYQWRKWCNRTSTSVCKWACKCKLNYFDEFIFVRYYIHIIIIINAINNKPCFWQKDSIVKNLIVKRHANPDQCNDTGWSSLHHAAYNGHYQTSKILIENGAKIDVYNHLGATALHVAVAKGHLNIIRYLNNHSCVW